MIEYADRPDGVEPRHLAGFFVGWREPPSPERHLEILRGSAAVVLAREGGEGGRVVGFVTDRGMGIRGGWS
jgi:hypothetical protein